MKNFGIGEKVRFRGKKAIIADRMKRSNKDNPNNQTSYALWDETGKAELDVYSEPPEGWIPADQITRGW